MPSKEENASQRSGLEEHEPAERTVVSAAPVVSGQSLITESADLAYVNLNVA